MKATYFFPILLVFFASCSSNSTNKEPGDTGNTSAPISSVDSTSQVNANACFVGATGNDTAHLRLYIAGGQATGEFSESSNGKVKSSGSIQGQLVGDTLLAWYSEGGHATKQMVFIIKNTVAVKGDGETIEKDGKQVLKDPAKADFNSGVHLAKVACNE